MSLRTKRMIATKRSLAVNLAAALAFASTWPVAAQTQPQTPAQTRTVSPAPTLAQPEPPVAPPARTEEQRQQLHAAVDKSDELLQAGKVDEALGLLEATEKTIPEDALVASALGSAYELKGALEEALTWIREGIKRDAGVHHGSEWLHARMIDARLALAKDSNWFQKNNVLGLDFGKDDVPVAPEILPIEQGRIKGADQLLDQISYQLTQRTKTVKPPEPVIGDLYASAGDLAIAGAVSPLDDRKSKIQPEKYYERALEYGAPHADLVRRRLAKYHADFAALAPLPKDEIAEYPVVSKRFEQPPEKSYRNWIYAGTGLGLILVVMAVASVLDRRRRKRAEQNPPPPLPDV
jgi:tetratricopeptide (TPR) repeat protein